MSALLSPLPTLAAWLRRAFKPSRSAPPSPRAKALESAALDRMLPMMLGNAPHPYQASLLLYLMAEQHKQQQQARD